MFETVKLFADIKVFCIGSRTSTVNSPPPYTHTYTLLSPHVAGVLSDVLNYVLLHAKDTADARGREEMGEKKAELVETVSLGGSKYSSEDVLVACFRFLKALGKNNIQIQRRCAMQLYACTCNFSLSGVYVTYQLLCVDLCPGCMTVWMTCLKLMWQFHTLRTF